jgi:hypothetical protein
MARSLNIVIGADIEKLQKGLNDAISAIQSSGSKMSAETAKAAGEIQSKLADIATKNPTKGTVRQLSMLAMQARALGPEFAATAEEIIRAAGKIKEGFDDVNEEIEFFSNGERAFKAVAEGAQLAASAFSVVQGVSALVGDENEDLQKAILKVNAAMAIANGVEQIANLLRAESALRMTVQAAAARVYAASVGTATGATLAFKTALMSIGIGVVIAAVGALVANFDKLKDAIFPADKALKDLNNTIDKSIASSKTKLKY